MQATVYLLSIFNFSQKLKKYTFHLLYINSKTVSFLRSFPYSKRYVRWKTKFNHYIFFRLFLRLCFALFILYDIITRKWTARDCESMIFCLSFFFNSNEIYGHGVRKSFRRINPQDLCQIPIGIFRRDVSFGRSDDVETCVKLKQNPKRTRPSYIKYLFSRLKDRDYVCAGTKIDIK